MTGVLESQILDPARDRATGSKTHPRVWEDVAKNRTTEPRPWATRATPWAAVCTDCELTLCISKSETYAAGCGAAHAAATGHAVGLGYFITKQE